MSEYCPHAVLRLSRRVSANWRRYAAARSSALTAVTKASGVLHFSVKRRGISPISSVPRSSIFGVASFSADSVSM